MQDDGMLWNINVNKADCQQTRVMLAWSSRKWRIQTLWLADIYLHHCSVSTHNSNVQTYATACLTQRICIRVISQSRIIFKQNFNICYRSAKCLSLHLYITQQMHTVFLQVGQSSFHQLRELLKTPPVVALQCLKQYSHHSADISYIQSTTSHSRNIWYLPWKINYNTHNSYQK